MNTSTVKLQIPLDKALKDRVEKHARAMGFSSLQDFTRVMFATVVNTNTQFTLTSSVDVVMTPLAEARYSQQLKDHQAARTAGKVPSFTNSVDALAYLHKL